MSKILIERSALEQALGALNASMPHNNDMETEWPEHIAARRALRAALEQPDHSEQPLDMVSQVEQEPVGCITGTYGGYPVVRLINPALVLPFGTALYTHPQPPCQPLTDEQIEEATGSRRDTASWLIVEGIARAVEAAHGIGGEK